MDNTQNTTQTTDTTQGRVQQQDIIPGAVKPRHLYVDNAPKVGDMYYSDTTNFKKVSLGSSGQVFTISNGLPTWTTPSFPTNVNVCVVTNTVTPTITNGSNVTFDTNTFDPSGMHSTSVNTDRITIKNAGKYRVSWHIRWADAGGGSYRVINLLQNASGLSNTITQKDSSGRASTDGTYIVICAANDYLTLASDQDTGAGIVISESQFSVEFITG
jgi:hypothetical protein